MASLGVEERDCVLASVADEVAVVAVDHCQAGAHERSKVEMPARSAKVEVAAPDRRKHERAAVSRQGVQSR
jgi:hypothetical protein